MSEYKTVELLGTNAENLLNHKCKTIKKESIHVPGKKFIEETFLDSNRSPQVIRSIAAIYNNGRLGGRGYVSILPVDQGVEHSAGASFAKNPEYFDPENIVKLPTEGGGNPA